MKTISTRRVGLSPRQNLCPAGYRAIDGGVSPFTATLIDGAGSAYGLDAAVPEAAIACEFDMGIEFTAQVDDNACISFPAYRFVDPAIGWSSITFAPGAVDQALTYVETVPGSNDANAIGSLDLASGVIGFDTSIDGSLVFHLYRRSADRSNCRPNASFAHRDHDSHSDGHANSHPQTDLPGPTGSGAVQVAALFCLGNQNVTSVTALPPGQLATAAELSGDCFAGDSQVTVSLADGGLLGPIRLGRDGIETITGLTASGSDRYRLTESLSGQSAAFDIAAGTVTRVIIRFEVALSGGEQVPGQTPGGVSGGGSTNGGSGNPLDLLGGLVTDELGGVANEGILYGSSADPQFFIADLVGDLDADEIAQDQGGGISAIGWRFASPGIVASPLGLAMFAAMLLFGWSGWSRRPASIREH